MLLRQIVIADYPSKIQISKARRPIYYVDGTSTKGQTRIPKKFQNVEKYEFNPKGILMEKRTNLPRLANPSVAGQPRYWRVNFQDIWNGAIAKHGRNSRIEKLKEVFKPYIDSIEPIGAVNYPLGMEILIFDTAFPVDVSNRGVIYTKVIEDLLVKCGKIVDDSAKYIVDSGRTRYILVGHPEEKQMVVNIYKSSYVPAFRVQEYQSIEPIFS